MHHPGAVAVVAVDDDRSRPCSCASTAPRSTTTLLEIPAGMLDVDGEDPLGLRAARARRGGRPGGDVVAGAACVRQLRRHVGPATTDLPGPRAHRRARRPPGRRGGGDDRRVASPSTTPSPQVRSGEITDAKTVIGLLLPPPRTGGRSRPIVGVEPPPVQDRGTGVDPRPEVGVPVPVGQADSISQVTPTAS